MRARGSWLPWALISCLLVIIGCAALVGAALQSAPSAARAGDPGAIAAATVPAAELPGTCYNSHGAIGYAMDVRLPSMVVPCASPHDLQMVSVATDAPSNVAMPLEPSEAAIDAWSSQVCTDSTIQRFVAPSITTSVPLRFNWFWFYSSITVDHGPQLACLVELDSPNLSAKTTKYTESWSTTAHGLVTASNLKTYMPCRDENLDVVACTSLSADLIEVARWYLITQGASPSTKFFDQTAKENCPNLSRAWMVNDSNELPYYTWPSPAQWAQDVQAGRRAYISCYIPVDSMGLPANGSTPTVVN